MSLPAIFERYRDELDREIKAAFEGRDTPLYAMMRYHLGWADERLQPVDGAPAGKGLRPVLCLLACEAAAGDYRRALPAAAAVELVHNYSLIHDDVQDDDSERRHRPTVWSLWGKPQAINAGSAMHSLASIALLRLGDRGVSPGTCLEAEQVLEAGCLEMIEGQYLDISYEGRLDVGVEDYLLMVRKKTGALLGCALEMGALLGAKSDAVREPFRLWGSRLGLAFQIRDDILGTWGKEEETGKPLAADIRRRKKTLPVVYALEQARGIARGTLYSIYRKKSLDDGDVSTVLQLLEDVEARAYAQAVADQQRRQGMEAIEGLPMSSWARQQFDELAAFLVERNH